MNCVFRPNEGALAAVHGDGDDAGSCGGRREHRLLRALLLLQEFQQHCTICSKNVQHAQCGWPTRSVDASVGVEAIKFIGAGGVAHADFEIVWRALEATGGSSGAKAGCLHPLLSQIFEKTKQEAKARREKLLAVQLELAQAEAQQSTVAGQINNIHVGKISQGFRASKAAGTVEKLCGELSRADELVAKVRRKLHILQGFSTGEVSRV